MASDPLHAAKNPPFTACTQPDDLLQTDATVYLTRQIPLSTHCSQAGNNQKMVSAIHPVLGSVSSKGEWTCVPTKDDLTWKLDLG